MDVAVWRAWQRHNSEWDETCGSRLQHVQATLTRHPANHRQLWCITPTKRRHKLQLTEAALTPSNTHQALLLFESFVWKQFSALGMNSPAVYHGPCAKTNAKEWRLIGKVMQRSKELQLCSVSFVCLWFARRWVELTHPWGGQRRNTVWFIQDTHTIWVARLQAQAETAVSVSEVRRRRKEAKSWEFTSLYPPLTHASCRL